MCCAQTALSAPINVASTPRLFRFNRLRTARRLRRAAPNGAHTTLPLNCTIVKKHALCYTLYMSIRGGHNLEQNDASLRQNNFLFPCQTEACRYNTHLVYTPPPPCVTKHNYEFQISSFRALYAKQSATADAGFGRFHREGGYKRVVCIKNIYTTKLCCQSKGEKNG